jgi:hypothetical protein
MNDQLDATLTVLLIFESAQHVSGNCLHIFRSVRLWFYSNMVYYCCKTTVLRSWRWAKKLPETCWTDSKINKIVIFSSSWSFILFLHTLYIGVLNGEKLFVSFLYTKYKCIFLFFCLIFVEHTCILYRYFYSQFYPFRHLGNKIFCIFME